MTIPAPAGGSRKEAFNWRTYRNRETRALSRVSTG